MKVFVMVIHFRYYPTEWGLAIRWYTLQQSLKIMLLCFQMEIYCKQEKDEMINYEED